MDGSTTFTVYPWLLGQNEIRSMARRRHRLVGAVPGARILVVGCGTGDDVLAVARLVRPGGRAFGVDRSEDDLLSARRRAATAGLGAKFHLGVPNDLPFPDASFDGVCAAWLASGPTDSEPIAAEVLRVVRPGGRIVIDNTDWARATIAGGDPDTVRAILTAIGDVAGVPGMREQLEDLAVAGQVDNLTISETDVLDAAGGTWALIAALADHAVRVGALSADAAARFTAALAEAVDGRRYRLDLPCVTLIAQRA